MTRFAAPPVSKRLRITGTRIETRAVDHRIDVSALGADHEAEAIVLIEDDGGKVALHEAALAVERDPAFDQETVALHDEIREAPALHRIGCVSETRGGLLARRSRPSDRIEPEIGFGKVRLHFHELHVGAEFRQRHLKAHRPLQIIADIDTELLALLIVEHRLDDGALHGIGTGGPRPR